MRNIACDQRSGEAGGPQRSIHGCELSGCEEMVLRLLGQLAVRRRVRRDPVEAVARAVGLGEPEQRRQQQPLAAAVVDVVEMPVDAAVRG